ncbi:unnamed protein product, partial [Iphiclides podalirius]
MLLRLLQLRIRRLGSTESTSNNSKLHFKDCYEEIISVIKTHQRLIKYGSDLENAFTIVNLINVLLSSVDICCVVFNISSALCRSQKPLYFTALKFSCITMTTYTSILTSSYSYFTLLYTVYLSD